MRGKHNKTVPFYSSSPPIPEVPVYSCLPCKAAVYICPMGTESNTRRGRPFLAAEHKRTSGPKLRFSDGEYAAVRREAGRRRTAVAGYIRTQALTCLLGPDVNIASVPKLNQYGKRLNQLVYQCHIDEAVDSAPFDRVFADITGCIDTLQHCPVQRPRRLYKSGAREIRTLRGTLRCTLTEREAIRSRAHLTGLSQAAFVRVAALRQPLGRRAAGGLVRELLQIQNNLNQLAEVGPPLGVVAGMEVDVLLGDIEHTIGWIMPRRNGPGG